MEVNPEAAWRTVFTPRDRRPIPDWAHEHVWLSPPITKTGFFNVSDSRHFIDVFASLQNDYKREVNVLKPVRSGGSLIGDIYCPWTIAVDPGSYMDVFQTQPAADDHGESRIVKIFEKCGPVFRLYPADRHKVRNNEIVFGNGHTWYLRGPSLGNLQGKSIRYLRMEEVWMWLQGRMAEAEARIGDYLKLQTSKILRISQAGPMPGVPLEESDWYRAYHAGDVHEWEVACRHCGKYFDPVFSGQRADGSFWGIQWDKHVLPNGDWDIPKCLPTIRFDCPHCSQVSLDTAETKAEWNRTGRYRRAAAEAAPVERKKDSFHWETVIDFPWDELVELWLKACDAERRGDLKAKIQFYQKRRAIFIDEEKLVKSVHLIRTPYEIDTDWPDERFRFLTADRQEEDMFWVTVRAWSSEKSRRLWFGKVYGFAAVEDIRIKMKVRPNHTLMDSNFEPKGDNGVYAACLKYGWISVRGDGKQAFPHRMKNKRIVLKCYAPMTYGDPGAGTAVQGRRHCPLIIFSKPQLNSKVQELIDNGRWEEPLNTTDPELEKEYSQQMAARIKKSEYNDRTGVTTVFWKESKNDHARDLANMQTLAAILADVLPDPLVEPTTEKEEARIASAAAQ